MQLEFSGLDANWLVEVEHRVVQSNRESLDGTGFDLDCLSRAAGDECRPALAIFGVDCEPVKSRVCHVVLPPDDPFRVKIAAELGHPGHRGGIEAVHPVPLVGVDLDQVRISLGVGFTERVKLLAPGNSVLPRKTTCK